MTRRKTQKGFSLLELMVAMMIIAVIATLGFKKFQTFTAQAHYIKSKDTVKTVREGLDQYYLKHGKYPDFGSFEAMVDAGSPLVKENMIPVGVSSRDGFDQPFEGKCSRAGYELTCLGDPNDQEAHSAFTERPGVISSSGGTAKPAGAPAGEPAAAKPEK
jgi:prepilin-type N-terminal cleavage/methylation domain-containing protein